MVLREQDHSVRAIAGAVGVTKSQVERDLSIVPEGTIPERVQRQGGGTYPSRRPTIVAAKNQREGIRAQEALAEQVVAGSLSLTEALAAGRFAMMRPRKSGARAHASWSSDRAVPRVVA